jgi:hypothetical protein
MFIFSNLRRYCGTSFIAEKMSWERSSGGFSFDLRVIAGGEGDVGARSAEHAVYGAFTLLALPGAIHIRVFLIIDLLPIGIGP